MIVFEATPYKTEGNEKKREGEKEQKEMNLSALLESSIKPLL